MRDQLLVRLRAQGTGLDRLLDLTYCPPGAPFPARFGLCPRVGCKGTTRDGRPCVAHAAIIGPADFCHWHDPALWVERAAWCAGRRGSRLLRWFAPVAAFTGHVLPTQGERHPDPETPLPPLDLAGVPAGQRRAIVALLAAPEGRTYPEAAAALGIHVGTLHRHLARVRARRPGLYAAVLAHRGAQLAARHERAVERARARRARCRARHRRLYGCEPWQGR